MWFCCCYLYICLRIAAGFAWMNWLIRKLRQNCLTSCVQTASQSTYNGAWLGFDFVLDYR